eukprot:TRINITY_DN280_c0_g1_i3.p1 TRINITY_DN280_c0_g1~~TRINITY_DN280_c0_g1_i3.p1  ORF type:complete len:113 (-),score=44.99 TRINITY_DN280_c0_g1_i3:127-465(-)
MSSEGLPEMKTLSFDEAKAAITEVISAFEEEENAAKMAEAKAEAGDDMMQMMQIVFPVALGIQQGVIEKYGFSADQQGVLAFTMAIRAHESDSEIAAMSQTLKDKFMPKPSS